MKKLLRKTSAISVLAIALCGASLFAQSRALTDYIGQFNTEVSRQEPLSFTGAYESGTPGIQEISLYYSWKQPMKQPLAREKFLQFIGQFLEGLNQNYRLKTQLEPFPFPAKGLDVIIFFRNDKGKYASAPYVGQIAMKDGIITYYQFSDGEFQPISSESYFKAKQSL